ncbi:MAG: FecR domain-containing protein [Tannerella sp.]|jgi:ferric-dicitrate binding protein FerR (iron transport regulator)|nr:FecR domain-containing protein [Tannerella sp.]
MEKDIDHVIARILSGEASPDDVLRLGRWLNECRENEKIFLRLKRYWTDHAAGSATADADALKDIMRRIVRKKKAAVFGMPRRAFISTVAAAVAALVISAVSLFRAGPRDDASAPETYNYYTYMTGDRRSTFTLDDGTTVRLNKNSRLTYSDRYGATDRRVTVDGEAFFDVVRNPGLPFEVGFGAADVSITVLGTIFNVRTDTLAGTVVATLVEGAIRFGDRESAVTLTPAQQLEFTYADRRMAVRTVDVETETAWKDGLMKYRGVAFAELVKDLGRIYGRPIHLASERLAAPSVTVSGTFEEGQTLEQIFEVIAKSLPFKWEKRGGQYYIR